jgi:hypothetical protein
MRFGMGLSLRGVECLMQQLLGYAVKDPVEL